MSARSGQKRDSTLDPVAFWKEEVRRGGGGTGSSMTEALQESLSSCSEGGSGRGMFSKDFLSSLTRLGGITVSSSASLVAMREALMFSKLFLISPIGLEGLSPSPIAAVGTSRSTSGLIFSK